MPKLDSDPRCQEVDIREGAWLPLPGSTKLRGCYRSFQPSLLVVLQFKGNDQRVPQGLGQYHWIHNGLGDPEPQAKDDTSFRLLMVPSEFNPLHLSGTI